MPKDLFTCGGWYKVKKSEILRYRNERDVGHRNKWVVTTKSSSSSTSLNKEVH